MTMDMNDNAVTSIAQLVALIKAAETLGVGSVKRRDDKDAVYAWIDTVLRRFWYLKCGKKDRGIIRRYLCLYSGYVASHVGHLIARWKKHAVLRRIVRT